VTSATDARRFLPAATAVAHGETLTLEVPLVMRSAANGER
jgi:hypothetical protein